MANSALRVPHVLRQNDDGTWTSTMEALAITVHAETQAGAIGAMVQAFTEALNALPADERSRWVEATAEPVQLPDDFVPGDCPLPDSA